MHTYVYMYIHMYTQACIATPHAGTDTIYIGIYMYV